MTLYGYFSYYVTVITIITKNLIFSSQHSYNGHRISEAALVLL
jgi:hypothetical protein